MSDFAFGVDIGGTRVKTGLVDISKGEILSSKVFESAKNEEAFLSNLKNALEELRLSTGLERRQICGAGVSVTGFVHSDGVMGRTSAAFLPFLSEYPIKKRLTETLEMPVQVDSDGRLVCYGECLYGAGRGYGRVLLITLGTGIGFCLLENATIPDYPAVLHMGGHIKVKNSDEKCYCGLTGCFEQLCSGPALSRRFFEQTGLEKDGEAIFRMAENKDHDAMKLIDDYIEDFCCGINQFIYSHAPDVIIVGGGVANGLKDYEDCIISRVNAKCYDVHHCDIRFAEMGDSAGILGSAALFKQN